MLTAKDLLRSISATIKPATLTGSESLDREIDERILLAVSDALWAVGNQIYHDGNAPDPATPFIIGTGLRQAALQILRERNRKIRAGFEPEEPIKRRLSLSERRRKVTP